VDLGSGNTWPPEPAPPRGPAPDVDRPVDVPEHVGSRRSVVAVNAVAVLLVVVVVAVSIVLLATNGSSGSKPSATARPETQQPNATVVPVPSSSTSTAPTTPTTTASARTAPAGARLILTRGDRLAACSYAPDCYYVHLRWEGFTDGDHEAVCRIRGRSETLTTQIGGTEGERDLSCAAWATATSVLYVTVDGVEGVISEW
jgi:hypothetical protein